MKHFQVSFFPAAVLLHVKSCRGWQSGMDSGELYQSGSGALHEIRMIPVFPE
ncbi:MAG: hypothetical protein LKE55_09445 [Prevotella sp.]|nr:hypothetical protein [Prevotella sp.]